ncbi:cell division protein FtsK [Acidipropionibacterium acidipropionici]|uniref:Cell division protein FtsK n=2 Tax=Acidipropionibacterium acidipropionici TaxID=1748 RepID=A0AAC8YHY2_9ACTN|nr:cell division protein FtsK [Acidipropionibacterium acidipropionici]
MAAALAVAQVRHDRTTNRRTELSNTARIKIQETLKITVTQTVKWRRDRPERILLKVPPAAMVGEAAQLAISQAVSRAWDDHFTVTAARITSGRIVLHRSEPETEKKPTDLDRIKDRSRTVAEQVLGRDARVDQYHTGDDGQTLDSFTIHHGHGAKLASKSVQLKATRIISSMLPGAWRTAFDLEHDTITVSRRPPLPTMVPRPVAMPAPGTPEWDLIPQAVDEDGIVCSWDISGVMAHQLKAGRTRTGKTVSLLGDAVEGARRGYRIFVLDPKRTEFLGLRTWPNVQLVATKVPDQVALVHYLWSLMEERYRRIEEEGASEADFERIMVLVDEYRQFYGNAKSWWTSVKASGMPAQCPVFDWIGSLLRMAGACRIHVILGTQRPDADVVGGEIRDNFSSRAALGPLSPEGARMMFDSEQIGTNIPLGRRGRGTWVGLDGAPKEVQYYYTPDPRKALSPEDRALLDQLRPDTITWPRQTITWPGDDQLDTIADDFPKRPSDDWLRIIGSDLTDSTTQDRNTDEDLHAELSNQDPEATLAEDLDQAYTPPEWIDPTALEPGMILLLDQTWVTITEAATDPIDADQTLIDYTSPDGQDATISIGAAETITIRRLT